MTTAHAPELPHLPGPEQDSSEDEVDVAEPVRPGHLTLVVSTDRAAPGASRRASMARHPSAVRRG